MKGMGLISKDDAKPALPIFEKDPGVGSPIFELWDGDRHYRIFADGRVEGCEVGALILNLIPFVIKPGALAYFSKSHAPISPT